MMPRAMGRRTWRAAFPLWALLSLWLLVFFASGSVQRGPNGQGFGGDFAIFLSASRVLQAGGNPYDRHQVYGAERRMLRSQGLAAPADQPFIRVGNPPLLFWLLGPLTCLPFRTAAWIWVLLMFGLCLLAALAAMRYLGRSRPILSLAVFAAMPQTILAAYYGNVDGIVVAAIGAALVLERRSPFAAGLMLPFALLKPQVALPIGALIIVFHVRDWRRCLAGVATSAIGLVAVSALAVGSVQLARCAQALFGYSHELGVQPDIASLAGLYVYWAGSHLRSVLQAAIIAAAAGVTAVAWWKVRSLPRPHSLASTGWLWIVWFLASPFAHFHDEVLLVFPLLAFLMQARSLGTWVPPILPVYILLLSVALFPGSRMSTDFQSVPLLGVALLMAVGSIAAFPRSARSTGTVNDVPPAGVALPVRRQGGAIWQPESH